MVHGSGFWLQRARSAFFDPAHRWYYVPRMRTDEALLLTILGTTLVSTLFDALGFSEASIVITYVLGVLFTALVTTRRAYCFIASAAGVLVFNFFFVSPRYSFEAWGKEYPSTFATMFVVAFVASTLAMRWVRPWTVAASRSCASGVVRMTRSPRTRRRKAAIR